MSSFARINTNIQSLQAFQNLQDTSSRLAERRERLTTGKRINSAQDDSAGFAIAKKLEARTRGQMQALKNITDAKSVLSVAEGGLDSTLDILQTQKEKAVQAANDSLGASERADIQSQLLELSEEVNQIADNAEFNGRKLLNGGGSGSSSQDLTFQVGAQNGDTFDVSLNSAKADALGTEASGSGASARTGIVFEEGFSDTGATLTNNSTVATTAPNEFQIEISNGTASASGTSADKAKFDITVQTGGGQTTTASLTVTGSGGADTDSSLSGDQYIRLTNGSGSLTASAAGTTATTGINVKLSQAQVNEIANETGEGSLTAFSTKSNLDVSDSSSANSAISTVDSAISEVTDQLASIGDAQTRLDFKESNLETTRTNLESARSGIEDANFAREQTQIAKLQILQQTGTAQLAQANAASRTVLSLIGG